MDSNILLNLLGEHMAESNPQLGLILKLINGEKPDMLSMLPIFMQFINKKEEPKQEEKQEEKKEPVVADSPVDYSFLNLDNYKVFN